MHAVAPETQGMGNQRETSTPTFTNGWARGGHRGANKKLTKIYILPTYYAYRYSFNNQLTRSSDTIKSKMIKQMKLRPMNSITKNKVKRECKQKSVGIFVQHANKNVSVIQG